MITDGLECYSLPIVHLICGKRVMLGIVLRHQPFVLCWRFHRSGLTLRFIALVHFRTTLAPGCPLESRALTRYPARHHFPTD